MNSLEEADSTSADSAFEKEAFALLSGLYSSFSAHVLVPRSGSLYGTFNGKLSGRDGRWLVELITAEGILNSKRMEPTVELYRRYGEHRYDGVLFILPEGPTSKTVLFQHLLDLFPDKFVEIATIPEIETAHSFDKFFDNPQTEYPGRIVEIGHNSESYHTAIEAIDAVTTRLASSNLTGLRADVRDRLLVEVQAGRALLQAATVRVAALGNTLVPALKYIADACAKATLGEMAKEALKALVKLLFS